MVRLNVSTSWAHRCGICGKAGHVPSDYCTAFNWLRLDCGVGLAETQRKLVSGDEHIQCGNMLHVNSVSCIASYRCRHLCPAQTVPADSLKTRRPHTHRPLADRSIFHRTITISIKVPFMYSCEPTTKIGAMRVIIYFEEQQEQPYNVPTRNENKESRGTALCVVVYW